MCFKTSIQNPVGFSCVEAGDSPLTTEVTCLWYTSCLPPSCPNVDVTDRPGFYSKSDMIAGWELVHRVQDLFSPRFSCLLQRCCPWCWKSSSPWAAEALYVHSMYPLLHTHTLTAYRVSRPEKYIHYLHACSVREFDNNCMVSNQALSPFFSP